MTPYEGRVFALFDVLSAVPGTVLGTELTQHGVMRI